MTKPLPKWIMNRYSTLWSAFSDKDFNHDECFKVLNQDDMTSITLSALKNSGWLEMKLDPKDARKRIYKLKSPQQAVMEMAKGK